jgi:hypothetical protein
MVRLQNGRSSVLRTRIVQGPWTLTLVNMSHVGSDMYSRTIKQLCESNTRSERCGLFDEAVAVKCATQARFRMITLDATSIESRTGNTRQRVGHFCCSCVFGARTQERLSGTRKAPVST